MTWRQLFARRPKWWIDLAARVDARLGSGAETRSSDERAKFWEAFRDGQREADRRAIENREALTPCRENGTPK